VLQKTRKNMVITLSLASKNQIAEKIIASNSSVQNMVGTMIGSSHNNSSQEERKTENTQKWLHEINAL
jgi:hypothetical protein